MTTIAELKVNHKDKWAVVKSKSTPKQIEVLPPHQSEEANYCLRELAWYDDRPPHQMLSPTDQTKYDFLKKRLKELEEEPTKSRWSNLFKDKHILTSSQRKAEEYHHQLQISNQKYDQLNDKLNWLRTLVRAGEYEKLLELVRTAKI